jgi:hypothetical protein
MKRLAVVISTIMLLTFVVATPTLAAAPSNDTYGGRETILDLPFEATIDTTEATTDADDAEWNSQCGTPGADASVWYEFTAVEDGRLQLDLASDFSEGAVILTGEPGSLAPVECYPYSPVTFRVYAGETYLIVAFDLQQDEGGNGGTLSLFLHALPPLPPTPTVDLTLDPVGAFNAQTGAAVVTGTVTCTGDDYAGVDIQLRQQVGRFIVSGWSYTMVWCDGTTQPWSAEVIGSNGLFKGGLATVEAYAVLCNVSGCGEDYEVGSVRLRR